MLNRKVPLYIVIVLLIPSIAVAYFIFYLTNHKDNAPVTYVSNNNNDTYCNYNVARLNGYKFIHPLLFAEPSCESFSLSSIKSDIENVISSYKVPGTITSASVYLREFHNGEWISAGDQDKYSPGSLLKVPELITFFKMNEKQPGLLDKKITFDKPLTTTKTPVYLSKSIKLGQTYTIRELLYYMVAYSDNNATLLLNKYIDVPTFKKLFTDLGLNAPDWSANEYPISAKDYSLFMKSLYNASYLTIEDSEYCTELLSDSDFKEGLVAGLPAGCQVVHKFGEGGYTDKPQLSESGIIYYNNCCYLLTVMTKGTDMKKLPQVISNISKVVFEKMNEATNVKI